MLPELTTYERSQVRLPMGTLDHFFDSRPHELPALLKLDVQGFELEVLRGGPKTLAATELVILETSLVAYTDRTLFQTDVAFVRKDSQLRRPRKFWLAEP